LVTYEVVESCWSRVELEFLPSVQFLGIICFCISSQMTVKAYQVSFGRTSLQQTKKLALELDNEG